jgi:hypothetical protein
MVRLGLQVGFGELIDPADLEALRGRVDVVRIDCQRNQDPQLAEQVKGFGFTPLAIIGAPEQILTVPPGALVEYRNEPDLFGPPAPSYVPGMLKCIDLVRHSRSDVGLFLGCVSNLQRRGYGYLRQLPWSQVPEWVGCSYHRYPHGNRGFFASANRRGLFGWGRMWTREEEMAELRRIVGERPLGCSEVGYNAIDYTDIQQQEYFEREKQFAEDQGLEFLVAYQIASGPPNTGNHENEYGFSYFERGPGGARLWKPVTKVWFTEPSEPHPVPAPPPPAEPPDPPQGGGGTDMNDADRTLATEALEEFYRTTLNAPVRQTHVDSLGYARWLPEYTTARAKGINHSLAVTHMLNEVRKAAGISEPSQPPPARLGLKPIVGYLRSAPNITIGDDTGPRIIGVCSWFPALRIFRDDRDEALRQMDRIVGRWQGARVFWHLGHPWWTDHGLGVNPDWPDFEHLFRTFLEEMWARELRVSLTCGDMQYLPTSRHEELYRRVAGICRSVNEQVICLSGMINEARVNSSQGEDYRYWANLSSLWQDIYPWGQHGLTDPGSQEEPAGLIACSSGRATVALLHGTRHQPQDAIRRAFNVRYEGTFHPLVGHASLDKPIWQDEPTGPGQDVYQPVDDRHWLFGLYTMHILTGQPTTYFSGASLRTRAPLDSDWGFKELPERWRQLQLPEDIGTWQLAPGHKPEAPLGARSFQNTGAGPHRVDQVFADAACYAVAYGGSGVWSLFSRLWDADYRVFTADGEIARGSVRRGETLAADLHAGLRSVVVELLRR